MRSFLSSHNASLEIISFLASEFARYGHGSFDLGGNGRFGPCFSANFSSANFSGFFSSLLIHFLLNSGNSSFGAPTAATLIEVPYANS
jgi:hypothetical protein